MSVVYDPPTEASAAASRGLALHARGRGGKSLRDATVGVARRMAEGGAFDIEEVATIWAWFRRFAVNKAFRRSMARDAESPAAVAWLLHGGDTAFAWAAGVLVRDGFTRERPRRRGR